jgi:SAM-dependent methyltransferase
MTPLLFKDEVIEKHLATVKPHFLVDHMVQSVLAQLKHTNYTYDPCRVLIIQGHGTPLKNYFPQATVYGSWPRHELPFQDQAFDLILDVGTLHFTNQLPQALLEVYRVLKPTGLYLAAFLGEETLCQLRSAFLETDMAVWGGAALRVAPFVKVQTACDLMVALPFKNPIVDHQIQKVHYSTLKSLMAELRLMGERGFLCRATPVPALSKTYWGHLEQVYRQNFCNQGYIEATFDTIFLTAWR